MDCNVGNTSPTPTNNAMRTKIPKDFICTENTKVAITPSPEMIYKRIRAPFIKGDNLSTFCPQLKQYLSALEIFSPQ
jgi:hypothetical protein